MKTRTANTLTTGILVLGAIGALSLVALAEARTTEAEPVQAIEAPKDPAPVVTSNCDKQRLADQLVRYLGLSDRVVVKVTDLEEGIGGMSLGGLIEIDPETSCERLPRFIAHELGHELDRADRKAKGVRTPEARQLERTAECIADRAYPRISELDLDPVRCTTEETARAATLAPEWMIR